MLLDDALDLEEAQQGVRRLEDEAKQDAGGAPHLHLHGQRRAVGGEAEAPQLGLHPVHRTLRVGVDGAAAAAGLPSRGSIRRCRRLSGGRSGGHDSRRRRQRLAPAVGPRGWGSRDFYSSADAAAAALPSAAAARRCVALELHLTQALRDEHPAVERVVEEEGEERDEGALLQHRWGDERAA